MTWYGAPDPGEALTDADHGHIARLIQLASHGHIALCRWVVERMCTEPRYGQPRRVTRRLLEHTHRAHRLAQPIPIGSQVARCPLCLEVRWPPGGNDSVCGVCSWDPSSWPDDAEEERRGLRRWAAFIARRREMIAAAHRLIEYRGRMAAATEDRIARMRRAAEDREARRRDAEDADRAEWEAMEQDRIRAADMLRRAQRARVVAWEAVEMVVDEARRRWASYGAIVPSRGILWPRLGTAIVPRSGALWRCPT